MSVSSSHCRPLALCANWTFYTILSIFSAYPDSPLLINTHQLPKHTDLTDRLISPYYFHHGIFRQPPSGFDLEQLPTELIQLVFQHAGPVDRAVLASASERMRFIGGARMVDDVWKDPEAAWEFLQRLERDADPLLVPCFECQSLHAPQASLPSSRDGPELKCRPAPDAAVHDGKMQPALYGLAKYERLGMGTSWFPEADKVVTRVDSVNLFVDPLSCDIEGKVNANKQGVFYRKRWVIDLHDWSKEDGVNVKYLEMSDHCRWARCPCGLCYPDFNLDKAEEDQEPKGSLELPNYTLEEPHEPFYLHPGFPFVVGPRAPVVGPMVACTRCSTDMQAEARYRADDAPQLVITTWSYHGPADTATDVRLAVSEIVQGFPDEPRHPRLSLVAGQIAEASGML
ncbi:hypothetical protein PG999_014244 [Apiospora kogelbergensis]|uniref:F-box domain-containing protein n=1 Tax=Apiospora kogelbergensis TaxID=1337665 RepID=A0AAW0QHK5_9PEZI